MAAAALVAALMATGLLHIRPGDIAVGTNSTYCGIATAAVSISAYCQDGH